MRQIAAHEGIRLLRTMTWVLCAVATLALIFTTVNVTRFATSRDVPLPIAVLLDPIIGTALAGVLYVDARLAAWGIRPPGWSTTLRWAAGCTAALMNSWESLWPDGQIGLPRQADPAAVLLHVTPALLLIALTETIAAYRRTVTGLLEQIGFADPTPHPLPPPIDAVRSASDHDDLDPLDPSPLHGLLVESRAEPGFASPDDYAPARAMYDSSHSTDERHHDPPGAPDLPPIGIRTQDAHLWPHAVALNHAARTVTGKPVSMWRLRTELGIGPQRARRLREQLLTRPSRPSAERIDRSDPPPPTG